MNVRVNGVLYRTNTGTLEVKRRFGVAAVLVNSEEEKPFISAVDAMGRFLVHDGHTYEVYTLQTGTPRVMAALASQRDVKLSQRSTNISLLSSQHAPSLSQEPQARKRGRSRSNRANRIPRRKGNYVLFVQSFMKSFLNVSFADAAKEWRLFPEEVKKKASVDILLESVRAKGLYQVSLA